MKPWNEQTTEEQERVLREAHDNTEIMMDERPNKNAAESICWDMLAKNGWFAQKRGWPDFLCTGQTDDFRTLTFCVEVKRHPEDFPRQHQLDMMRTLERAGIPCFIWDRHTGFKRVGSSWDELGKQPGDVEFPDPAILRCVFCSGGGKQWESNPQTPRSEIKFEVCGACHGTGLAMPRLAQVT